MPLAGLRVPLLARRTPHKTAAGREAGRVKDEERITQELELVPQKPEAMFPRYSRGKVAPGQVNGPSVHLSSVTGDHVVDTILPRAASYTSGATSGSVRFWQWRTPILAVDAAVSSGTASVKSRDNLLSKPGYKTHINKSWPNGYVAVPVVSILRCIFSAAERQEGATASAPTAAPAAAAAYRSAAQAFNKVFLCVRLCRKIRNVTYIFFCFYTAAVWQYLPHK